MLNLKNKLKEIKSGLCNFVLYNGNHFNVYSQYVGSCTCKYNNKVMDQIDYLISKRVSTCSEADNYLYTMLRAFKILKMSFQLHSSHTLREREREREREIAREKQ